MSQMQVFYNQLFSAPANSDLAPLSKLTQADVSKVKVSTLEWWEW